MDEKVSTWVRAQIPQNHKQHKQQQKNMLQAVFVAKDIYMLEWFIRSWWYFHIKIRWK